MIKITLTELFERELQKLKTEINLYKDEDNLWIIREEINNSAGNLCLHLIGNLNHFIGAILGNNGYIRHREDEFSLKNIPRPDLIINIENCLLIVNNTFLKLSDADMDTDFPVAKNGTIVSNTHMLLHLYGHLTYHLGQINYHRRLLD